MADHPYFCDCDPCLNKGGGTKLSSPPVVYDARGRRRQQPPPTRSELPDRERLISVSPDIREARRG